MRTIELADARLWASLVITCFVLSLQPKVVVTAQHTSSIAELLGFHAELQGKHFPETTSQSLQVPHIIHQTWKSHTLPPQFETWSASWTQVNPGWIQVIWTDEENRRLVEEHYPSFLQTYDALPANICRADAIRPLLMHRYGGVYSDLDSQALRPLEGLLEGKKVVLARMGDDEDFDNNIPNAWMASLPGQHFWMHFLQHIITISKSSKQLERLPIEAIAGPMALKQAVEEYNGRKAKAGELSEVTILPPDVIFPVNWAAKRHGLVPAKCDFGGHPEDFDAHHCIAEHHPEAYSVQWWSHSWGSKGSKRLAVG